MSKYTLCKAGEYITSHTEQLHAGEWSRVSQGMVGHQVFSGEESLFRRVSIYHEPTLTDKVRGLMSHMDNYVDKKKLNHLEHLLSEVASGQDAQKELESIIAEAS